MNVSLWLDNEEFRLDLVEKIRNNIEVSLGKKKHQVFVEFINTDEVLLNIDGKIYNVIVNSNPTSYSVFVNGRCYIIEKRSADRVLGAGIEGQRRREIKTSMPGKIVKVLVSEGAKVKKGQAILILEAMKMQNEIKSPQPGKITQIKRKPGESVETGSILFTVE